MSFYFVKTPRIIQSYYKNYIWKINTDKKEIYLTFDDGPTPVITEFVLDVLKKHNAKATFFCIGKNAKSNPELFQRIITEKHTIGNHTQDHLNGWNTDVDSYVNNVTIVDEFLYNNSLIKDIKLFRPPYGKIKSKQAKRLIEQNYKIVMWSVLSGDFDTGLSINKCLKNVIKNTNSGSIVVFHDSEKAFNKLKSVLPKMLTHFSSLGFNFKAI